MASLVAAGNEEVAAAVYRKLLVVRVHMRAQKVGERAGGTPALRRDPRLPGKLHALGGFFLIALSPFTRLVHIVTFPITYLWRPYQVVIWNRRPAR